MESGFSRLSADVFGESYGFNTHRLLCQIQIGKLGPDA
jgi:hypothetical protein